MITQLTPEQEALIPVYREKWRAIALSTERIDRRNIAQALRSAYYATYLEEPDVIICDSPYSALGTVLLRYRLNLYTCVEKIGEIGFSLQRRLARQPEDELSEQLHWELVYSLQKQLHIPQYCYLTGAILRQSWLLLGEQGEIQLESGEQWNPLNFNYLEPYSKVNYAAFLDFCSSVLKCHFEPVKGRALQSIVKYCGWILPFEGLAIVSDRPTKLAFDDQGRLHADKESAIEFADGFCVYAQHGELITEPDEMSQK
jgi:hypothetical protein